MSRVWEMYERRNGRPDHRRRERGNRERVRAHEIDLDAVRDFVVTDGGAADADADDVTAERMVATVRDEFDLPNRLSEASAGAVLSEAFEHVVAGEFDAADDLLAAEFGTVCERASPALADTDAGHPAACHLHDERATGAVGPPVSLDD